MKVTGTTHRYGDNVDTDVIIPARYLNTSDPRALAAHCMEDIDASFAARVNPGEILVAGRNFGSGSSREHAAWAIAGHGFRAVVASSFADIHKQNELNNFVLPVVVSEPFLKRLTALVLAHPETEVEISLPEQTITIVGQDDREHFDINAYKKHCFLNGLDDIAYLLTCRQLVEDWEARRDAKG